MKARSLTRYSLIVSVVVSIVGCDRVSKQVATEALAGMPTQSYLFDVVRLSYAENPGSFLSLGAQLPEPVRFAAFTLGVGILLGFLMVLAFRNRRAGNRLLGLAMVAAGGTSNWADRLADGSVVDFLNIGIGPVRTGIFNVADMAILAGVAMLMVGEYSRGKTHTIGESLSS